MTATKMDISSWFDRGVSSGATHMIVVCDTFDHEDYPVFATGNRDFYTQYERFKNWSMQRIMEVYDLNMDKNEQLSAHRVFNLP